MNDLRHFTFVICGFLILVSLGFAGCRRDKCKRVTCVNGQCVDGTCNCETGYFTGDCSAVINAGYEGDWTNLEECTAGSDNYTFRIQPSADNKTEIGLIGLWELQSDTIMAVVAASGLDIAIARQAKGNVEIAGDGLANDAQDEITLTYRVYNPGQSQPFDRCTAVLSKN